MRLLLLVSFVSVAMSLSSSTGGSSTVIVGLNGALQKRFVLPEESVLVPGDVHRASSMQVGVGGKGQDVAIALSCLGYRSPIKLAQFVGSGYEGDNVHELLQDRLGRDAMSLTVRTASSMRTCTTIVASDTSTELVEPSGTITSDEIQSLLDKLATQSGVQALCFMGSMPPGCSEKLYAQIYNRVHENGGSSHELQCVIDTVAGLEPLLNAIADSPCVTILKVNASELCRMAGINKSSSEANGVTSTELVDATKKILKKFPRAAEALSGFAITDGKHPAHFVTVTQQPDQLAMGIYRIPIADLKGQGDSALLYPIGAGDTVAAGTLAAWRFYKESSDEETDMCVEAKVRETLERGVASEAEITSQRVRHMVSAFTFGLACGSASCLQEENSMFEVKDAIRLFHQTPPAEFVSSETMLLDLV